MSNYIPPLLPCQAHVFNVFFRADGMISQRQQNLCREDARFVLAVEIAVVFFDDLIDAAQAAYYAASNGVAI